jgi:LacI family transcriptional regulator, fructose operon transcriptional repressor
MPTLKEVAEAAGVSTATVSRVLSNQPYVKPEMRERVMAMVAKLEYRPNLVARSLRSQQSSTIGLIVSDIRNPFFTAISRAVEDTAYARGYKVMICNTDENPEKEALYLDMMRDEHVAGVIFSPTRQTLTNFAALNITFPIVLVDRSLKNGGVDAVLLENVAAGYELTTHLIENGYGRIAAICGEASTTGRERWRGYEMALREHDLAPAAEYVKYLEPTIEVGYKVALDMLASPEPPDAFFMSNSLLMAGALQAIRDRNLTIPDDVALVGFDETIWASLVQPAMTLIAQPTDEIGKTATELLLQRVADPGRAPRTVLLKGQLLVRGSSAPRAKL